MAVKKSLGNHVIARRQIPYQQVRVQLLFRRERSVSIGKGHVEAFAERIQMGEMKLSVLFIKDEADKAIGALAIVTELSGIPSVSGLFSSLLEFETDDIDDIALMEEPQETRPFGIEGIEPFILNEIVDPKRTTPEEKTELITDLYDMGVFSVKGSVMETASILGMSEQSVYRYIAKIKRFRGE